MDATGGLIHNAIEHNALQRSMANPKAAQHGAAEPLARYIAVDTFSTASARRKLEDIKRMIHRVGKYVGRGFTFCSSTAILGSLTPVERRASVEVVEL